MNILIVNQPLNNRGDESAHRALVRSIIKHIPDANVRVLFKGANPDSVSQFSVKDERVQYVNVSHKHWMKADFFFRHGMKNPCIWHLNPNVWGYMRNFQWADAVVCAPGGICMGGFMNWDHEHQLMYAMKLHRPIFYFGRSIGPFWDEPADKKLFKDQAIQILNYCSYVSLREAESVRIAYDLGIKDVVETVDTAFLDYPDVEVPHEIRYMIGNSPYVVFVPNLLIWHYYYNGKATISEVVDFWSKIVDVINKHYPNHKIVMLPQTFNYGGRADDIYLFREIERLRPNSHIVIVNDCYSSDIQQQIIRGSKAMFGARYHSVVFAINNDVPFVAFSYEHKISGLLEELDLQDEMIDIKGLFTSGNYNNSVIEKLEKILSTIHRSHDGQETAKKKAMDAFNIFVTTLKQFK